MRLCSMAYSDSNAPQYVLSLRHRLQMSGIHTCRVSTEMVELHPFGYGADEEFVNDAMRISTAAIKCDAPVALFVKPGPPFPASRPRCDLFVKTFYQ